jgi:putative membrane protein
MYSNENRERIMVFFAHLFLTAALLLLVANLVKGVQIEGWGSALIGALVLGLVNAFVRPVMVLLTLPLTVVTFGLFLFVVNALVLWLVAALVPGFRVQGFWAALLGSLVLTLLNLAVAVLLGPGWTAS